MIGSDRGVDGGDNARRDAVLSIEDVLNIGVVPVSPYVVAVRCLYQLCRDPHPVARPAHTAFEDELDIQLLCNLRNAQR
jgi:hypothetical protein